MDGGDKVVAAGVGLAAVAAGGGCLTLCAAEVDGVDEVPELGRAGGAVGEVDPREEGAAQVDAAGEVGRALLAGAAGDDFGGFSERCVVKIPSRVTTREPGAARTYGGHIEWYNLAYRPRPTCKIVFR